VNLRKNTDNSHSISTQTGPGMDKNIIPSSGHFMMEQKNVFIPLFGKWAKW
jgi:hypothetical protein